MKRATRIVPAFLTLVALLCGTMAQAQLLKQVPADAMVVIKFKNMKATSDKMAALANKWQLVQVQPAAGDPLGSFKQSVGATNGLKEDGDAAFVIRHGPEESSKPNFIALLPVSDYKAFIGNYADAKTEGDITEIKFPFNNDEGYVAQWGDYAAVSETKEALAAKPAGITPSGLSAKEIDTKDVSIYVNMKAVAARALPKLKESRTDIKEKITEQMQRQNPQAQKYQGLSNAAIDEALGLAEEFLQQSQSATLGIALSEESIQSTGVVEFDPASKWGTTISGIKNSNEPLIVGLPEAKYLFLAGLSIDSEAAVKLIDDLVAPVQGELDKLGDQGKAINNYVTAIKGCFKATRKQATGMIAPAGMMGQEALIQAVTVMEGKSDAIVEAQKDMFNTQQALMDAMGTKSPVETSYTANAKTLDGVQLNQFLTKVTPPGANPTPQEMQMQQMMGMLYGPNGMNGYIGAVSPEKVIVGAGVSDAVISKTIASAKAGDVKAVSSEGCAAVTKQLPKDRVFVLYVPLDNIASTLANYARMFGMPINVQLPENLAPIGVSAGTEGPAIRVDSVIPADTVQSMVSAAMQAKMNMMGGPGGPGGGGGGNAP